VEPGAVNVGHSQSVSLNQLLDAVRQVLGSLPEVTYGEARAGDIRHSKADNSLLRQRYQLAPATPLAQGLARLLGR
jgi:UDP-glucose 4-epimerase